jgi:hypothetical protein
MYFIPSLKQTFLFKELTIGQLKNIVSSHTQYPTLNSGFNYEFINCLLINSNNLKHLTSFDKYCLGAQIHFNEILQISKTFNFKHPLEHFIKTDILEIKLEAPVIEEEKKYYKFLIDNNVYDKDVLLLTEISKYVKSLFIKNTNLKFNSILEKNNTLKKLPIPILTQCIQYIDSIKQEAKQQCFNKEFNISLLIL